jgi:chromate transporter
MDSATALKDSATAWDSVAAFFASPLSATDLLGLFIHFLVLSLLAVGGAITTAPGMHRYVVLEHPWITDAQFTASIALAQAAPGPNILFVAVIGWNVAGPVGALVTMVGIMLPSTTLTLIAARWGRQRRETRGMRAFTTGMTPITIGLLVATGWILAQPYIVGGDQHGLGAVALMAVCIGVMMKTRLSPIWLVGLGAVVGAFGWV